MSAPDWLSWITTTLGVGGAVVAVTVSHTRLASKQDSDRELLETKLQAEASARLANEALAVEKHQTFCSRLEVMEAEQARARGVIEQVAKLAAAVEAFGRDVSHAQEMAAVQIENLARRMAENQERTDARFVELKEAISDVKEHHR